MARRSLRPARLRQAGRLRVSQGEARLRAVPDRGTDQSEYRNLPTAHAVEPDGLAGDPRRELACDPYRELDPLCIAALFAGGAWTLAGAQTRDRILWRTCGDEGDARRGTVGALRSWHCAGGPERHNANAARRPCGRSGARGTRPLHSSNGAVEIRRLGEFRHGARRPGRAFGRYEPAIGWPLGCHRATSIMGLSEQRRFSRLKDPGTWTRTLPRNRYSQGGPVHERLGQAESLGRHSSPWRAIVVPGRCG